LNAKGEFIHRNHDELHYQIDTPKHKIREPYPWENGYIGQQTKITKEYFRCKGSGFNPPRTDDDLAKTYFDCGGCHTHSLPVKQGKEFIYPVLIDLLNFVQEKTHSKVVITCGHRCPAHNTYADSFNSTSKHMVGAEVDFYVEGMEEHSEEIIAILQQYYQEKPEYSQEYLDFERSYHHLDVSVPAWYNKEILIQLYQKKEDVITTTNTKIPIFVFKFVTIKKQKRELFTVGLRLLRDLDVIKINNYSSSLFSLVYA
jgi:hypothetical protein